eukprot:2815996-Prymnesium_polylepis.1
MSVGWGLGGCPVGAVCPGRSCGVGPRGLPGRRAQSRSVGRCSVGSFERSGQSRYSAYAVPICGCRTGLGGERERRRPAPSQSSRS